jgi:hypothetical protein
MMLTTTASHPSRRWHLPAAIMILACAVGSGPGLARATGADAFDGNWSVVITTQNGDCDPSLRYGVRIADGQVFNNGASIVDIRGRVAPDGLVRVDVQSGNQWASGSGRLEPAGGGGMWSGQGSAGFCTGTWVAQRETGGTPGIGAVSGRAAVAGQARTTVAASGPPPETYVPGRIAQAPPAQPTIIQATPAQAPVAQGPETQGEDTAYCAAHFRSYDPATGTYMGYDGLRHPCP